MTVSSERRAANDVAFIPGHGKPSTFAHERQWNMFVSDEAMSA